MVSKTAASRVRALADGNQIPLLGLGVWQVPNGPECVSAVRWALDLGYRHLYTAQIYGNEESVGRGLIESGVPRDQVFITTKFDPSRKDPEAELEHSLTRLGLDYVDLYLVHWPRDGATRAWPAMEAAHELGYARSIGVSNFGVRELEQMMESATSPPVVDRFERWSHTRPGAAPLGPAARCCRTRQIKASRAPQRECPHFRLHPVGPRHGSPGRARPDGRYGPSHVDASGGRIFSVQAPLDHPPPRRSAVSGHKPGSDAVSRKPPSEAGPASRRPPTA